VKRNRKKYATAAGSTTWDDGIEEDPESIAQSHGWRKKRVEEIRKSNRARKEEPAS
jgi:hypothetical protein